MPCNDGGFGYGPTDEEILERKMPAVLCAAVRKYGIEMFNDIDWKEAGVTKMEFLQWLEQHNEKDRHRNEMAEMLKQRELEREEALLLLSDEQKKALGLK